MTIFTQKKNHFTKNDVYLQYKYGAEYDFQNIVISLHSHNP